MRIQMTQTQHSLMGAEHMVADSMGEQLGTVFTCAHLMSDRRQSYLTWEGHRYTVSGNAPEFHDSYTIVDGTEECGGMEEELSHGRTACFHMAFRGDVLECCPIHEDGELCTAVFRDGLQVGLFCMESLSPDELYHIRIVCRDRGDALPVVLAAVYTYAKYAFSPRMAHSPALRDSSLLPDGTLFREKAGPSFEKIYG